MTDGYDQVIEQLLDEARRLHRLSRRMARKGAPTIAGEILAAAWLVDLIARNAMDPRSD